MPPAIGALGYPPEVAVVNSSGAPVALTMVSRWTPSALAMHTKQSPPTSKMPSFRGPILIAYHFEVPFSSSASG